MKRREPTFSVQVETCYTVREWMTIEAPSREAAERKAIFAADAQPWNWDDADYEVQVLDVQQEETLGSCFDGFFETQSRKAIA